MCRALRQSGDVCWLSKARVSGDRKVSGRTQAVAKQKHGYRYAHRESHETDARGG